MYPLALEVGIDAFSFWNMTFGEINETIKAYSKRQEREQKLKASFDYKLANLIAGNITNSLSKEPKNIYIWDAYPTLFDDLKKENEATEQWKTIKNRLDLYNEAYKDRKGVQK